MLRDGVWKFGEKSWKAIVRRIEPRSPAEFSKRWNTMHGIDTMAQSVESVDQKNAMDGRGECDHLAVAGSIWNLLGEDYRCNSGQTGPFAFDRLQGRQLRASLLLVNTSTSRVGALSAFLAHR
ncbi:hypothetical protein PsorP6_006055 [Peronosclerospora sorghi]|uniref:Uncharacterized protein n=1 Tax=Peronosclerospora sorghi TaxID=230839 RepID=A0ACC0W541_9STRA|nr:hypothetical protein PsorP6_006055 [Peronosclerospora sorghi]